MSSGNQQEVRIGAIVAMLAAGLMLANSTIAHAGVISANPPLSVEVDENSEEQANIIQGLRIAPVPLNMRGKNAALVGLGSYIVNAVAACNDCHTSPSYAVGGDPYLGQKKQVNAAGYLGGGVAFGPFVSRNITPDATGLPIGGDTYTSFKQEMLHGIDPDNLHPQFGPFLQVMPWPAYQDMTDHDLRAIYEYLSAIPCVEGPAGAPPNRCR